ncbi:MULTISPECIES: phage terminase large subunit [unclassified Mesorhizobium]|uniref:phage terminase large subunit n=1 Tax=unclassified Mesorhizobium TaxID=325217 RepID=UPI000412E283|nr:MULTISPECIES: phage terminase large subunit [unclassified Mesorhizobium]WJI52996.1 phage terminase large subunit [Mesorhizobium sp. C089B]
MSTQTLLASTSMSSPDPLREDLRNFIWLIWQHLRLPSPTPTQYDIAQFLQHGPNKICIEAFRGVGKSFLTAAFVLWCLYCNPQLKIMVVSASKNRADNFVIFCQQLIQTVPELAFLKPKANQRSSRVEFDVGPAEPDQTPSVFAKGIDSQLTGGRADIIVSDDVEVMNNSMTVAARDLLIEKTREYSAILKPLAHARVIYLGTPQTEDSIYNKLPETFTKRIWPSQVPTVDEIAGYGLDLAPRILRMFHNKQYGMPTDPERFDMDELISRRAEYGAAGYQLQFMLNTKLSDEERYPLKLKDLIIMPVPPQKAPVDVFWLPNPDRELKDLPNHGMAGDRLYAPGGHSNEFLDYQHRVMSIDPSGRGKDETGYAVGLHLAGNTWVPEAGGLQGGYDEDTLLALVGIAKRHRIQTIVIESNFGDGMFAKLLEPVLLRKGVTAEIVEVRSTTMKEQRILDILEPVIGSHRLIVDPDVFEKDDASIQKYESLIRSHKSVFHQMTHICREKDALRFDDRVDALAMLIGHFVEMMNQDAGKIVAREHQEWMEAQIAKLHQSPLNQHFGGERMSWAGKRIV